MLDKIKNSKIWLWLVGIGVALLGILEVIAKVTVNRANKDLDKADVKEKALKAKQEGLLKEANKAESEANEVEKEIAKIKEDEDWHKTFKRRK